VDIDVFIVERAIVHQIPQAKRAEKATLLPTLADTPSKLDARRKTYFQRRIRRSLQNGFEVEHSPDAGSPVPALVVDFFKSTKTDRFVEISQDIARHLHASQGGSSPSGLVAVLEGTIGAGKNAGKCLVVLKLEMEEGVHFELVEVNGKKTFEMEVEEVTLTDTTRVFKASLFERAAKLADVRGLVSDAQLESTTIGREIADYFLEKFLGCRIRHTPTVATKRYLETVEQFINELPSDDRKLRYEVALLSDLNSQSPTINPEAFARNHLDQSDRDLFLGRFREGDGRIPEIDKDIELVQAHVKRAWVELDNGVRVSGPPEAVQQTVAAVLAAVDKQGDRMVEAGIRKVR